MNDSLPYLCELTDEALIGDYYITNNGDIYEIIDNSNGDVILRKRMERMK